ncbi:hypothetical protein PCASD_14686 [Puccinia coronata f. sp. avenae]|uniref:Uncharacterized protein n=1 Tax=Puccinia coronata f. sp. avenae TaxID=200324 RepID=A0A2N5TED1_9BASI|nr:hypothetical protein PCASD_14686 [Puccinia coronata f. sp. avenae]
MLLKLVECALDVPGTGRPGRKEKPAPSALLTLAQKIDSRPVTLSYRNDAGRPAPGTASSSTRLANASPTEAQAPGRYSLEAARGSRVPITLPPTNPVIKPISGMNACSYDPYQC